MNKYIEELKAREVQPTLGELCYRARLEGAKWSEIQSVCPNALNLAKGWSTVSGMVWPVRTGESDPVREPFVPPSRDLVAEKSRSPGRNYGVNPVFYKGGEKTKDTIFVSGDGKQAIVVSGDDSSTTSDVKPSFSKARMPDGYDDNGLLKRIVNEETGETESDFGYLMRNLDEIYPDGYPDVSNDDLCKRAMQEMVSVSKVRLEDSQWRAVFKKLKGGE